MTFVSLLGRRLVASNRLLNARSRLNGAAKMSRRRMGDGQPESQSMKAELFGGPTIDSGWVLITNTTYALTTFGLFMVYMAPDTNIKTWASAEARERLALKAAGKVEEFEFGKHYYHPEGKFNYESKFPDNPFDEDLDDDDDEDEEEEDEEGEGGSDDEEDEEEEDEDDDA